MILNTAAVREYATKVEQKIRVRKEKNCGTKTAVPLNHLQHHMLIKMVHFTSSRIFNIWIPRELISCHELDAAKHCHMLFGTFCELHDEPDIGNNANMNSCRAFTQTYQVPLTMIHFLSNDRLKTNQTMMD